LKKPRAVAGALARARGDLRAGLLAAALLAPAACLGPGDFHCVSHDQCGAGHLCEPGGHCSAPDKSCDSGRRYLSDSGAAQSGQCVGDACPGDPIVALRSGASHSCVLRLGGTVWCWGDNGDGQLGDGTTTPRSSAVQAQGIGDATALAVGQRHTCVVRGDGTVWCWGDDSDGQLGDPSLTGRLLPGLVVGLDRMRDLAAGSASTCALTIDGTVSCWGSNAHGQLGDGSGAPQPGPVQVFALTGIQQIASYAEHVCALRDDESLWCWGSNAKGQLGDGTATDQPRPVEVLDLMSVTGVSTGSRHTCASTRVDGLFCWGDNDAGQLGQSDSAPQPRPVPVPSISDPIAVAVGAQHSCAVRKSGGAWCWGDNSDGQLGDGTTRSIDVPVPVTDFTNVVELAAGDGFTCGRRDEGTVWCWGDDHLGQLGTGSAVVRPAPFEVPLAPAAGGGAVALDVTAGGGHSCAVLADQSVACWGSNQSGQLGDNTTVDRASPAATSPPQYAEQIVAGGAHTCEHKNDPDTGGDLGIWCWGRGDSGQIGLASLADTSVAVLALGPELGQPAAIAAGDAHTCALLAQGGTIGAAAGGVVWCWGDNSNGQLGDGTSRDRSQPASVSALDDAAAIATGGGHTCARRSDGTVWCWGDDSFGQLGDGGTSNQSAPVQARRQNGGDPGQPGDPGDPILATAIAAGGQHSCALSTDGSILCWGRGDSGQLGGGDAPAWAPPAPVLTGAGTVLAGVTAVAAGGMHTCALTGDGRVWCWGANATGQLGDGTVVARAAATLPVLALDDAVQVTAGASHTCARRRGGSIWCWGANLTGQLGDGTVLQQTAPQLDRLACP
jgi:alpha-tubulin suppressor-like RCC1 family protein